MVLLVATLAGCTTARQPPVPEPAGPARAAPPEPAPPPLPRAAPREPAPPPPPRVAPREPAPPPLPSVLSPPVAPEEEQRIHREAQSRIEKAERLVSQLDRARLVGDGPQDFDTIQSFLAKAKEALAARDVQRAFILADKAYLLADQLARGPR